MNSPALFASLILASVAGTEAARASDEALFLLANAQFTLCHEIGHLLVDELGIPVLGREEDAVDQLAAICILHPSATAERDPEAAEKLIAVAEVWRLEWETTKSVQPLPYWDSHSLDIQRFFNIVCMIYGSDPERYADVPARMGLPWERAWSCEEHEYAQAVQAGRWLLDTYRTHDDRADRPARLRVEYEPPSSESKARVLAILREAELFERKAALLDRLFGLPRTVTIAGTNCMGDKGAYWRADQQVVVFCYELLEHFARLAAQRSHSGAGAKSDVKPDAEGSGTVR